MKTTIVVGRVHLFMNYCFGKEAFLFLAVR